MEGFSHEMLAAAQEACPPDEKLLKQEKT